MRFLRRASKRSLLLPLPARRRRKRPLPCSVCVVNSQENEHFRELVWTTLMGCSLQFPLLQERGRDKHGGSWRAETCPRQQTYHENDNTYFTTFCLIVLLAHYYMVMNFHCDVVRFSLRCRKSKFVECHRFDVAERTKSLLQCLAAVCSWRVAGTPSPAALTGLMHIR